MFIQAVIHPNSQTRSYRFPYMLVAKQVTRMIEFERPLKNYTMFRDDHQLPVEIFGQIHKLKSLERRLLEPVNVERIQIVNDLMDIYLCESTNLDRGWFLTEKCIKEIFCLEIRRD